VRERAKLSKAQLFATKTWTKQNQRDSKLSLHAFLGHGASVVETGGEAHCTSLQNQKKKKKNKIKSK